MENVLIIAPHADDEVLGCGAAIQWHVEKGDTVYVVILSNRVINHHIDEDYIKETKSIAIKSKEILSRQKGTVSPPSQKSNPRQVIILIK